MNFGEIYNGKHSFPIDLSWQRWDFFFYSARDEWADYPNVCCSFGLQCIKLNYKLSIFVLLQRGRDLFMAGLKLFKWVWVRLIRLIVCRTTWTGREGWRKGNHPGGHFRDPDFGNKFSGWVLAVKRRDGLLQKNCYSECCRLGWRRIQDDWGCVSWMIRKVIQK